MSPDGSRKKEALLLSLTDAKVLLSRFCFSRSIAVSATSLNASLTPFPVFALTKYVSKFFSGIQYSCYICLDQAPMSSLSFLSCDSESLSVLFATRAKIVSCSRSVELPVCCEHPLESINSRSHWSAYWELLGTAESITRKTAFTSL